MGRMERGRGALIMEKTGYAARAEARGLSVRYGIWYVVRSRAGEYYATAYAPEQWEGAPELVATYINGAGSEWSEEGAE